MFGQEIINLVKKVTIAALKRKLIVNQSKVYSNTFVKIIAPPPKWLKLCLI